jgi:hypothetical protein
MSTVRQSRRVSRWVSPISAIPPRGEHVPCDATPADVHGYKLPPDELPLAVDAGEVVVVDPPLLEIDLRPGAAPNSESAKPTPRVNS